MRNEGKEEMKNNFQVSDWIANLDAAKFKLF